MTSLRSPRQRLDVWIVIGLFVLAILLRLPFRSRILHHWDSINFALALDTFDIRRNQPHPPGTFVIYVFLGRALQWLISDPNESLVWLSILPTALSAGLIYVLGKEWVDRAFGLAAAALMLTSPLLWFHGEIALTYMLEFLWVLMIVFACFKLDAGNEGFLYLSALLMGLAGGIRPNTPVFLFPLWLYAARKSPLLRIVAGLGVMAVGVAIWVVPLVAMSGGPLGYWNIALRWAGEHTAASGRLREILENGTRMSIFILYCLGLGVIPVAWALWRHRRDLVGWIFRKPLGRLFAVWVTPALIYFVFVHLRQAGHTFTIMPAAVLLLTFSLLALRRVGERGKTIWRVGVAAVVLANGLFFVLGPASFFGSTRITFIPPTWPAIRAYDDDVSARLETIRALFAPEETVVFATGRNYRVPDFYLPDYQLTSLSHELGDDVESVVLPENVTTLVVFDDATESGLSSPPMETVTVAPGREIRYLQWGAGEEVVFDGMTILVRPR